MHLSLLLSITATAASTYAAAVGYTIQSLDNSLADLGLKSYAKDANLTKGWNQATRCAAAVSYHLIRPRHSDGRQNTSDIVFVQVRHPQ